MKSFEKDYHFKYPFQLKVGIEPESDNWNCSALESKVEISYSTGQVATVTRKKFSLPFLTTESYNKQHTVLPSNSQVVYSSARKS